ncbi:MAG: cupin domain-containing protein [Rhodocyclales bacterium]|nr:cupin domain-containing protein [Rhodocyclales bacterium]
MNAPFLEALLGGMSVAQFLAEYWQKKPLLVRNALPGFTGLLSRDELFDLAGRDDAESRFVSQAGGRWTIEHGPFTRERFRRAKKPWTTLVQGLNLLLPEADRLMREFSFIPYARLDDLMVSYANDGGGVGPHFDNYDVFLLQGIGQRRWRIGNQKDQRLIDGLPLRILADFRPKHDWVLESGDLLYLPPEWAHDGVAIGECMTYSVGFRTAPAQELAEQFLLFLAERVEVAGRYRDPDLAPQKHPAEIGAAMREQVKQILAGIRWNDDLVAEFLGCMLTDPKAHVYFERPAHPLSPARFAAAAAKRGLRLDARTQLLFSGTRFFVNGEQTTIPAKDRRTFRRLADSRRLDNLDGISASALALLHEWYRYSFLTFA